MARLLQQVSGRAKAVSSRSTVTRGSSQQPSCFSAGYYSLLPRTGARIPVSIAFSGGPAARLPRAALGWSAGDRPWACVWGQGTGLGVPVSISIAKGEPGFPSADLSSLLRFPLWSLCPKGLSPCTLVLAPTATAAARAALRWLHRLIYTQSLGFQPLASNHF